MSRQIGFLFSVAILVPTLLASASAFAQQPQPQQNQSQQGLPPNEVAAICPPGSHWVDAGFTGRGGNRFRQGHCQREFAHLEK